MEQDSIIPAQQINEFKLRWSFDELKKNIKRPYEVKYLNNYELVIYNNFTFCIENAIVTRIIVKGDYKGKYKGIGIGSTLKDFKQKFGGWDEILYTYYIPDCRGLSFELADNTNQEEWIEEDAPIEKISVYAPEYSKDPNIVYDASINQYIHKDITERVRV